VLQGLLQQGVVEQLILRLEELLAAPDAGLRPPHLEASPAEVLQSVPVMVATLERLLEEPAPALMAARVQHAKALLARLSERMARLQAAGPQ
jgi:hypothetical protein